MKMIISAKTAGTSILILLAGLLLLHIFILAGIVSFELVWGGNISDKNEMISLEIFALLTTFLFGVITLLKLKNITKGKQSRIINMGVWIMFAYFTVNIIGNFLARSNEERLIFIPVSIILAILSFSLAITRR